MPIGFKNPGILATEVRMTRTVHDGPFLLVEGVDDVRFWTPRCRPKCDIVDGEGKRNVVGALERLDAQHFSGALGVVDDDALYRVVAEALFGGCRATLEGLMERLPKVDPWYVARGHDLVALLRVGLMKVLGSLRPNVGVDHLASILRAAISSGELSATALWKGVRAWEGRNPNYPLLAERV